MGHIVVRTTTGGKEARLPHHRLPPAAGLHHLGDLRVGEVFADGAFLGLAGALVTDYAPLYILAYPPVLWLIAVSVRGVVRMIEKV